MREARPLVNAAGEIELDRLPARANLVEGLAVYALALGALWGLVGFGLERGSALALRCGYAVLAGCVGYALLLLLAGAGARGWPNLLARLGVRRHFPGVFEALTGGPESVWLGALVGAAVLFPLALLLIRWDNFLPSLRALLPLALLFAAGALALGAAHAAARGDWSRLDPSPWLSVHPDRTSPIFYLVWGFAQQALCLGYFNGRLRRGIGPRGLGPLPGRGLAALATGALFAGLHLPAWHLVGLTFLTGSALAWYFQADRTRNLFSMALVHAIAGTLLSRLLPLSMDVGPWPD